MDTKLSHLDEYKTLREEITLYQHEMHRTWLWAIIAAGAVYTWLPLHRSDVNTHLPSYVWWIPPILLFFCAIRYFLFRVCIRRLDRYLFKIEEDAFGQDKLPGIGHYERSWLWDVASFIGPGFFWLGLIICSIALSWNLSR
jgi:hypothetical protein